MPHRPKPTVLIILDGWGFSEASEGNAIAAAHTPTWDRLWSQYPHTLIDGSGEVVGLPDRQMGNSEVGHLNLGAGRVVYQDITRINRDIETGAFAANPALVAAVEHAAAEGRTLHLMGLLSPGGVHSHEDHFHALLDLARARGARRVLVHAFLDGRDTPPRSAEASLRRLADKLAETGLGRIATIVGRYYAMDRDQRWDRVAQAYHLIVDGAAAHTAETPEAGLAAAYARDENDEFVQATRIGEAAPMADGDSVVFLNFRADRARQLTAALTEPEFTGFERQRHPAVQVTTMTEYRTDLDARAAYPPESLRNGLGEYLSNRGLRQLRIAETEKYAHVTYFFNGGEETPFPGEDRVLVPSPKVATYDLQPEMSAAAVTDRVEQAIREQSHDLIVCNYANADMVGHSGNMQAAIQAVACLDQCLARIEAACLAVGGECLITADHGNVERMQDARSGQAHTAHTTNLVPLVYLGRPARLGDGGVLSDVAPTLLHMMGLPQPVEMTGRNLIAFIEQ